MLEACRAWLGGVIGIIHMSKLSNGGGKGGPATVRIEAAHECDIPVHSSSGWFCGRVREAP